MQIFTVWITLKICAVIMHIEVAICISDQLHSVGGCSSLGPRKSFLRFSFGYYYIALMVE